MHARDSRPAFPLELTAAGPQRLSRRLAAQPAQRPGPAARAGAAMEPVGNAAHLMGGKRPAVRGVGGRAALHYRNLTVPGRPHANSCGDLR